MIPINVNHIAISKEILAVIPALFARRFNVLPLGFQADVLLIAMLDSGDDELLEKLENLTGHPILSVPVTDVQLLPQVVARYYPVSQDENSISSLFDQTLNRALQLRASDIHIEPGERNGLIKFRVDGRIRIDDEVDLNTILELSSYIKVLAHLDISEKRIPLDGNIHFDFHGEDLNLRIATLPTLHGEHVTLRILFKDELEQINAISSIGMSEQHLNIFSNALNSPNGIILISGPTGSGKTTTLYAALRQLKLPGDRHIVSIEDPVEIAMDGITQVKIDEGDDRVSFHRAMRSVLRHDPDIIMLGEIRDAESADIAVKCALTGHLVLSTIHTNSAVAIPTRLINLGVPAYLVASTLRLAVSQRLVRKPCPYCKKMIEADYVKEMQQLDDPAEPKKVTIAVGCQFCGNTGYAGRTPIFEMIPIDNEIRSMLTAGFSEQEFLKRLNANTDFISLRKDGLLKVQKGETTLDEILQATDADIRPNQVISGC